MGVPLPHLPLERDKEGAKNLASQPEKPSFFATPRLRMTGSYNFYPLI